MNLYPHRLRNSSEAIQNHTDVRLPTTEEGSRSVGGPVGDVWVVARERHLAGRGRERDTWPGGAVPVANLWVVAGRGRERDTWPGGAVPVADVWVVEHRGLECAAKP